jgi:hypothetical protein
MCHVLRSSSGDHFILVAYALGKKSEAFGFGASNAMARDIGHFSFPLERSFLDDEAAAAVTVVGCDSPMPYLLCFSLNMDKNCAAGSIEKRSY